MEHKKKHPLEVMADAAEAIAEQMHRFNLAATQWNEGSLPAPPDPYPHFIQYQPSAKYQGLRYKIEELHSQQLASDEASKERTLDGTEDKAPA